MLHSEDTWQLVGNILVGGKHKHMLHRYYSMWRDFSKWSMKSTKRQYPFKFWQRNILYVSFPSSILFRTTIVKMRLFPYAVISTLWCDMPPFKCIVITDMMLIKTKTAWKDELGILDSMNSMRTAHRMHKRVSDEQVDVIWNWSQMIYRIVECARLQGLPEFMLCLILRQKNVCEVFWRGNDIMVLLVYFSQPPFNI